MPSINEFMATQAPMVNTGSEEPAQIVTKLRQALDAVNRLSGERAALEEALKVEKNKDNILPRIMAVSGSYDKLFAEELKKYDPLRVRLLLMDKIQEAQPPCYGLTLCTISFADRLLKYNILWMGCPHFGRAPFTCAAHFPIAESRDKLCAGKLGRGPYPECKPQRMAFCSSPHSAHSLNDCASILPMGTLVKMVGRLTPRLLCHAGSGGRQPEEAGGAHERH